MVSHARQRSLASGVPFDLTYADFTIPAACPVFNIPLTVGDGKLHDGSPTLDRLVNERGYVKGNVVVVSAKANRAKNNLTLEELEALAAFYSRHLIPAKARTRKEPSR